MFARKLTKQNRRIRQPYTRMYVRWAKIWIKIIDFEFMGYIFQCTTIYKFSIINSFNANINPSPFNAHIIRSPFNANIILSPLPVDTATMTFGL